MTVHAIEPLGFRAWYGDARPMAAEHTHGDVEVNLCVEASLRYRIGGTVADIPPGHLAVLWAAVPHQLLPGTEERPATYWVTIPLDRLLAWSLPSAFVRDLLGGLLLVDRIQDSQTDVAQLSRWAAETAGVDGDQPDRLLDLEVQARLLRMASRHGWDVSAAGSSRHLRTAEDPVQRIARTVVERHVEPLDIGALAAEVGWHPNYAMTRFRHVTGMTIGMYLAQHRIAHARRLLATTDDAVLDIGYAAGFGSASRFHAAFLAVVGMTPAAYRRSLRAPVALSIDDASAS